GTKAKSPPARTGGLLLHPVREKGLSEGRANLVGDALEAGFIGGDGGQDLAVQLDARLVQAVHELRVGEAFGAGRGVDALDPQGAERALLVATVAVGVLTGAIHCGLGGADGVLAAAVEALGLLQDLLVLGVGGDAPGDASHYKFPFGKPLTFAARRLTA